MKIAIVRRELGVALSMDVYTDNLVAQLQQLQPTWEIVEIAPARWSKHGEANLWQAGTGLRKYYERLWRHPRQVSQIDADIYHIVDRSNAHVAYWLTAKRKPIVVTCHDLVQFVYPSILKDQARFPAVSMASWKYSVRGMKCADRIVAVSTNTAADVTKMLNIPPERISAVPNGVDPALRQLPAATVAAIRARYERSPATFCLLNVGSNHQRKNILTIFQVLVALRDRGVAVQLWKVGDEFTTAQQDFIAAHDLESMITFIGAPNKATLLEIYNAADALLAPSLYEGFGLKVLEAMACGTPVIAANVSSLPEVTGSAAILVAPLDVTAIADAVCALQQDPALRHSYIDRGLARAQLFSWTKSAHQVAQIYQMLTKS